jgi:hypothetical protein
LALYRILGALLDGEALVVDEARADDFVAIAQFAVCIDEDEVVLLREDMSHKLLFNQLESRRDACAQDALV